MKKILFMIFIILVFVTSVFAQTGLWKYPASYNDPDNQWLAEELIGDKYLNTAGTTKITEAKVWSSFIELIRNVPNCGAVRFYAYWEGLAGINLIDVDLYYNDMWNDLYEGVFGSQIWEEKSLGTVEFVTKARVRFYAKKADTAYLYAFQFYDPVYHVTLGASRIATAARVSVSDGDGADVKDGVAWEIDSYVYEKSKNIEAQDISVSGVCFNPDGTKMYIMGYSSDTVYQYALSTAYDVNTASYNNVYVYIGGTVVYPKGLTFSPDGTKMYIMDTYGSSTIWQFTLNTPWLVSSAVYANKSFAIGNVCADPYGGLQIHPSGTYMYVLGDPGDVLYQLELITPYDISTAVEYKEMSLNSQDITMRAVFFKTDGMKFYTVGDAEDAIFQYNLTSAWDIDTASYADKFKDISSQDVTLRGLFFKPDGTIMYHIGRSGDGFVYQYRLSEAWVKTNDFILATRIYGSRGPYVRAYKLRWRVSGGTFVDVSDVGAITYSAVTDLGDGGDLLEEEKLCDAQDGYTWQNGLENEGDNLLPDSGTYSLADEYYTEFQWALSCDDAIDESIYEFELWDVTEPLSIGTGLSSITIAITTTGWTHKWNTEEIAKFNDVEFTKWNGVE